MTEEHELMRIKGAWNIPYSYSAGATATRFFRELRDAQRILATKCPRCERVLVPPRPFCERCFVATDEWLEVGPSGTVETFTITYATFVGLRKPPFAIALIRLDGASTALAHFLDVDISDPHALFDRVKRGLRVAPVFRSERTGSVLDIEHFTPID